MEPRKFPDPIEAIIPIRDDGAVMYSMMAVADLMKLRSFLDDLIKWKCAGNPVHIGTIEYTVTLTPPTKTTGV